VRREAADQPDVEPGNPLMKDMARSFSMLVLACSVGACASTPPSDHSRDQDFKKAHLACYQQMMAVSQIGQGLRPNRHQYLMCMQRKGYDV